MASPATDNKPTLSPPAERRTTTITAAAAAAAAAAVAAAADGGDDEGGDGDGDSTLKLTKAAKRRLKEKLKKQEALAAALAKLGDTGGLEQASKEQLAAAHAMVRDTVEAESASAGAFAVELPVGEIRPEPKDGNIFPLVRKGFRRQTFPEPTVPVCKQFAPNAYPAGQIMEHPLDHNTFRIRSEEKRALERLADDKLQDLRQAAEVHRQVRRWTQTWLTPGLPLITIADRIEAKLEQLIVKNGIKAGQAFPTGLSVNWVAAHFTPNTGDRTVLRDDDVLKIDFGTQINGHIIDSAWTYAANPRYDPLLEAVRTATNEGIKQAGIDVRLGDVGAAIQEVMESYEVEIDKKTYRVKAMRNLSGHNISPYVIHGGKSVPMVKSNDPTKMEEGELFAIETFGTTGKAIPYEDLECSHYAINTHARQTVPLRSEKAQALLKHIQQNFHTLAFCRKWLDKQGHDRHLMALNQLSDAELVTRIPPLCDIKSSYTAQFEHTFILRPTCKEVLSRGSDY